MSERQRKTAQRVANVPDDDFEQQAKNAEDGAGPRFTIPGRPIRAQKETVRLNKGVKAGRLPKNGGA